MGKPPHQQWWAIRGDVIMESMYRASGGEDPELLYLELIANSAGPDDEIG